MRFLYLLSLLFTIVCFMNSADAELIDNSASRLEYARSITTLNQKAEDKPSTPSTRKQESGYTLVLFRTTDGIPVFDKYEPDILIAGPHHCFTAAYLDYEKALASIDYLKEIPEVIYAELDGEVLSTEQDSGEEETATDPSEETFEYEFHSSGARQMGFQDVVSWSKKSGEGSVLVAVIDSGIYPHTFLSGRLYQSGYDYVDNDEDATSDTFGHGTHVAGVIVDCTPDLPVFLRPIRVLNSSGIGSTANTTSAIFEAAETGSDVINLSLVSRTHSDAMEDAILFALNCGVTVVISAGNNGENTSGYCPVHMNDPGFIVVGACTGSIESPEAASYSNYGFSVDVYAFGNSIQSCSLSGGFTAQTGTSQAAPHISALCAIMKLLFPSVSCEEIERRVKVLAGDGEVNVPNATSLVPATMGFEAEDIYLPVDTQIKLLSNALPETSFLNITWQCADNAVATVDEFGMLSCLSEGTTVLYGEGSAKADVSVILHVVESFASYSVPVSVTNIESEAFSGTPLSILYLPASIEMLESDSFSQSELKTIFYSGNENIFHDMETGQEFPCIIVSNNQSLWRELHKDSIPYLIDNMN